MPSLKAVPPSLAQVEPAEQQPDNRSTLHLVILLTEYVRSLQVEKERLLAALRREAHHMDQRAPHSGRM